MFKLFKYLKRYVGLIVGIVVLLFLQAFCDLSLPDYTARIVNVGIQQQGIEDGVPDQIRITSLNRLKLFMTEEEQAVVDSFYTEDGDVCRRGDVTEEEREELDQIFSPAMMIASELASDNETTAALKENMGLPADADLLAALEQAPGETLAQMQAGIEDTVNGLPESIVSQAAVAYVRAEYEALGLDVDGIQMRYLAVSGGQKQRLSIARAIAKNPEIFIFDDSFSALDYKTDATLRKALKKATKDATTLIVAQRISTILHADRIIVLDEGRMAGQGTHQELMKNCQVYREIAMSQLSEEELANE